MASNLPEELIKEILSHALLVTDEKFADTGERSSFCRFELSSSTVLVVCKQWLRVGTPMLYEVVVIRSKAQAQLLASVFKNNRALGRFVKRMRVEGGYGKPMEKILSASPNITDLFITTSILSNDSVKGLTCGLPLINPTHVIFHEDESYDNAAVRHLTSAVTECIKDKWVNMTSFHFPYVDSGPEFIYDRSRELARALQVAPKLKEVVCTFFPDDPDLADDLSLISENPILERITIVKPTPEMYGMLRDRPKLKSMIDLPGVSHVPDSSAGEDLSPFPMTAAPDHVKRAIWAQIIKTLCESYEYEATGDYYTREEAAGDLRRQLQCLKRVSKFFRSITQPFLYRLPVVYRLTGAGGLFVDKLMNNPALGGHVKWLFIKPIWPSRDSVALNNFGTDIDASTATETNSAESESHTETHLDPHISELDPASDVDSGSETSSEPYVPYVPYISSSLFYPSEPGPDDTTDEGDDGASDLATDYDSRPAHLSKPLNPTKALIARRMLQVISQTPNLAALHGCKVTGAASSSDMGATECCIDWNGFKALAMVAGHSVMEITNVEIVQTNEHQARSPAIFSGFTALRELEWKSKIPFGSHLQDVPHTALSRIERLYFETYDPSIFAVLARMNLPLLTTLGFKKSEMDVLELLTMHGTKILRIELEQQGQLPALEKCPNTICLVFTNQIVLPQTKFPWCSQRHQSVAKIVITTGQSRVEEQPDKDEVGEWTGFLEEVNLASFPALRELQLLRFIWPVNERQTVKSPWPAIVEPFIKRWNVSVTDADGLAWRPRLQSNPRRKQ